MVGNNVRGKCDQCGEWYYTKEIGSNGRWIPDVNPDGSQKINPWGKPQYLQHVHECRGPNNAYKATTFEKQINTLADDVDTTRHTNMKNLFSFASDMALVRSKVDKLDNIERDVEKIKMDLETFLRSISKSWFTQANQIHEVDQPQHTTTVNNNEASNGSDLADEIANTDDQTELNSHSINFVDQRTPTEASNQP